MGRSASPRKAYKPKFVSIPMMAENRNMLAMHLHIAVDTLIAAPSVDAYNRVSKMLATLYKAGCTKPCLTLATHAVNAICDRFERVQKVGVSEDEATVLRHASGELDEELARIPFNKFKAASQTINRNFALLHD